MRNSTTSIQSVITHDNLLLSSLLLAFCCAAVQRVRHNIHVSNQSGLCLLNRGHAQGRCKRAGLASVHATAADYQTQSFVRHLEGSFTGEDAAQNCERVRVEAPVGFFAELALGRTNGAPAQTSGAFGEGNQLTETKKNVLETR